MKVFISWSGENSKRLASILHDWLPSVIQNIRTYMSAENIDKGERWSIDIATQLQETNYGIVCVTPDNITAPWILFESGALSKSIQNSRVSPIIFGLSPSDLAKSPLLQFQLTQFNKADLSKLLVSINNSAPEPERVSPDVLNKSFNRAWSELESSVSAVSLDRLHTGDSSEFLQEGSSIGASITDAVQEILTNSRSQLKLLNSPSEILPAGYLETVLGNSRIFRGVSLGHPAWRDIDRGLDGLDILQNLIGEQKLTFDPSITNEDRKEVVEAAQRINRGVRYIKNRSSPESLHRRRVLRERDESDNEQA